MSACEAGHRLDLLAEMARNESETLRERIKSGLALARKRGVLLGRRKAQRSLARNLTRR